MRHQAVLAYTLILNGFVIGYVLSTGAELVNALYFIALEIILLHISFSIASMVIAMRTSDPSLRNKYVQSIFLYPLSLVFYIIPAWFFLLSVSFLEGLESIGTASDYEFDWFETLRIGIEFFTENFVFTIIFSVFMVISFTMRLLRIPYTWSAFTRIKGNVLVLISPLPIGLLSFVFFLFFSMLDLNLSAQAFFTHWLSTITVLVLAYKAYVLDYLPLIQKRSTQ